MVGGCSVNIFASILNDLLFIFCIVLLCKYFIVMDERNNRYNYMVSIIVVIISSITIYNVDNIFLDFVITLSTILFILMWEFKEKLLKTVFISIWLYIFVVLLESIAEITVSAVSIMIGIKTDKLVDLIGIAVTLTTIYSVVCLLKRKNNRGIKGIKIGYLILYTILTAVDAMALILMYTVTEREIAYKNKILYAVIFIFVSIGMLVQLGAVILFMVSRDAYKQKEQEVHKYLDEQIAHYEYLEKREIETKKFRHDLKHHVYALETLADGNNDEYKQYYNKILEKIDELQNNILTKNGIVDAILNKFYVEAREKGITFKVEGHMPDVCYIEAYDLCSIFSNILSNAIEASESSSKKEIHVELNNSKEEIIITISNYYEGMINIKNDEIQTTKADKSMHGWGIRNIQDSVKKYNGCMDINTEKQLFYITILLENIPKETS